MGIFRVPGTINDSCEGDPIVLATAQVHVVFLMEPLTLGQRLLLREERACAEASLCKPHCMCSRNS